MPDKSQATFFKEEVEQIIFSRYPTLSVYETVGALEAVKANLLERLGNMNRHVIPIADSIKHEPIQGCCCQPIEIEPGIWVHHADDGRESYERATGLARGGWEVVYENRA